MTLPSGEYQIQQACKKDIRIMNSYIQSIYHFNYTLFLIRSAVVLALMCSTYVALRGVL